MIEQFLADYQQGHSNFQMAHFITGKSGTNVFGWYKQCLWELVKRWQSLRSAYVDLEILEAEIEGTEGLERKQKEIQREHTLLGLRDTEREFSHFYQQAEWLKPQYDKLSREELLQQEREHWVNHVKREIALDYVTDGRASRRTNELLFSLPADIREAVSDFVPMEWLNKEQPRLQFHPHLVLPHREVRRLIESQPAPAIDR